MPKSKTVKDYIQGNVNWTEALTLLRDIILKTELKETIKWGAPVYTLEGKNVIGLAGFKNHFGIWFFNGVYLKDKANILVNAQEKTKALRQMRFESEADINQAVVLSYVEEAIANQKAGKEFKPTRNGKKVNIPKELKDLLGVNNKLSQSFNDLAPSKQREYCEYIASAKRATTKQSRLVKICPMILKGIGLNDKYKNC